MALFGFINKMIKSTLQKHDITVRTPEGIVLVDKVAKSALVLYFL